MSACDDELEKVLALRLDRFDLSTRTANCINLEEVSTVRDLAEKTANDILHWRNAGQKTLQEIRQLLGRIGLKLSGDHFSVGEADTKLLAELAINAADLPEQSVEQPSSSESKNVLSLNTASEHLQRALVTSAKELRVSARAQTLIRKAGAMYLGELAQLTFSDVLRNKNAGRKTAEEVSRKLQGFGLKLGMSIPDWSRDTAAQLSRQLHTEIDEERRIRDKELLDAIAGEPTVLDDELYRVVCSLNRERDAENERRNTEILLCLWGWRGDAPRTLESVGQQFDITRERVRQIEARALKRLANRRFEMPLLRSAIALLRQEVPDLGDTLALKMRDRGVSRNAFNPWSVKIAAENFKLKWPFDTVRVGQQKALTAIGEGEYLSQAPYILRRRTSERGCVSILSLAAELKLSEEKVGWLIRFLEYVSQLQWLDEGKQWLYSTEVPRNRLLNLCSKVLGVSERVHISELRRAVSRSRRLAMCPPQRILASFVEKHGIGRVEDNVIHAIAGMNSAPASDSAEGRMIQVLDAFGPVLDGEVFAEKCVAAGMNATTFYIYRMNSPVVCALGKNVYCKVGAEVLPGTVEDIAARRRRSMSVTSDHGWTFDGKLWFGIELTLQTLTAGGIRLASFVSDLVQGEDWRVLLPDGTEFGGVKCRNGFIWSFRKQFNLLGAEPGDLAIFEFDLKARTVLVRVGGPGLFEAIQDPESASIDDGVEDTYAEPPTSGIVS